MATAVEEPQTIRTQTSWDKKQWGAETQRWDRSKWVTVFSSHNPTIREVTECLGMRLSLSASGTNRGIPKFDAPIFKELSQEIMKMSKEMPKERDLLLDCATDPGLLETQLDEVLDRYGPQIWGKDADRSRLLTPNPEAEKPTYFKDLFYEDLEDRAVIKTWLHRWIVIKACYYIRNRKIKKPSIGEDDSFVDVEPYSPIQKFELVKPDYDPSVDRSVDRSDSTLSEYKSVTPPTEVGAQQPPYERKSPETNGYPSQHALAAAGSRKRSRLSPDLAPRKSPRKSLASDVSMTSGPPSSGARTRPPSPVNVRFANTFAAVNRPLASSAEATPTRIAAANSASRHSIGGAPSPRTAVHTLPSQPPTSNPEPGHNAPAHTANAVPDRTSSFKPVNPLGVTIVPINRSPRRSVSPRDAGERPAQEAPYARHANNDHREPAPHHAAHIARGSPYQERAHLHNQQRHEGPPPGAVPREGLPPIALRDPRAAEAYHNHNVPQNQGYHPHIQPYPHGGSGHPSYQQQQQQQQQQHGHPHGHGHPQAPAPAPQQPHQQPHPHHRQSVALPNHHTPSHAPAPAPASLPSNPPSAHPSAASADMTLRQCELLGHLMAFFFPRDAPAPDESLLLQNLSYIWSYNEGYFRAQLGPMYEVHARVLTTWIEERTRISQLQSALERSPTLSAAEMVERLLAMNDLRVLRLKWRSLGASLAGEAGAGAAGRDGGLVSAEDLLCRTFSAMTRTEGTEGMFRSGLEAVNERVFEFLRSEDMKISVVGH